MDFANWDWPAYSKWLFVTEPAIAVVFFTAVGVYLAIVLLTRLQGLRSFSKMSGFDFAITVAMGAVMGSTVVTASVSLLKGAVALAALFTVQYVASTLRERFDWFNRVQDNDPLLLMAGEEIFEDNLRKGQMTRGDLLGKLREANVIHTGQVRAVVMEPTGDVSVLHAQPDGPDLEPVLLEGVRDVDRMRSKANVEEENQDG